MTDAQVPAGWYPDPAGDSTKVRYWDGSQWTEQLQDAAAPAVAQAPAATPAPVQAPAAAPAQTPVATNAAPQYAPQNPYGTQAPAPQQANDKSGLAIASLVLGIIGPFAAIIALFGYVCGILAIVFGVKSLKSSRRTMAIIGIILGVIALLAALFSSFIGVVTVLSSSSYYY